MFHRFLEVWWAGWVAGLLIGWLQTGSLVHWLADWLQCFNRFGSCWSALLPEESEMLDSGFVCKFDWLIFGWLAPQTP